MTKTTKPWTPDEIAFLRENYYTLGYEAIAKELGRTDASIKGKAQHLRMLKKNRKPKFCWSSGPKRCPHCGKAVVANG
jgi:hypothetical protein